MKAVPENKHAALFESGAMLNYYACLQETEEEETKCNDEVTGTYIEFSNVDAELRGDFKDADEIKPMKYYEAINGPDGEV